jgi:hypothetical protein
MIDLIVIILKKEISITILRNPDREIIPPKTNKKIINGVIIY